MWRIELDPDQHQLSIRLTDHVSASQMRELATAHTEALEHAGTEPFKVFIDLRGLFPLESDAVAIMGAMKRIAADMPGFRGFAILADSPTVAMQQRRTRVDPTTHPDRELITLDPEQAKRFLNG